MPFANQYYRISDRTYLAMCCDEIMFRYTCRKCDEVMGCYYCDFSYNEAHKCDDSYPQLQKVIHNLWESRKNTLMIALSLTRSVRSTLSTRARQRASSRRVLLTGALCIVLTILSVNESL